MADVESERGTTIAVPSMPYVIQNKLSVNVKSFLASVFSLFCEDGNEKLDQGGLMSLMLLAYPDQDIPTLRAGVEGMLEMELEDSELTFEQLFNINRQGADDPDSFKKMLNNLKLGYDDHAQCHAFLEKIRSVKLPVICEPLELILIKRGLLSAEKPEEVELPPLSELSLKGVAQRILESDNVVVMAGAGISTSCGIPDFRSPGTGLYDNLQQYNLPEPQAIFDINYFKENPEAFFMLSKEIYPENFLPSPTHYFISLLAQKGKLKRHYTQNIDGLERLAGVPEELLVEAHGSYKTSTCTTCGKKFDLEQTRDFVFSDEIPRCDEGIIKPDITFFGEGLPKRFEETQAQDLRECELMLIMGTSLAVAPFCTLKDKVRESCPRVLVNMERVSEKDPSTPDMREFIAKVGSPFQIMFPNEWNAYKNKLLDFLSTVVSDASGFVFQDSAACYRDVFLGGKCDESIAELVTELGWADEWNELMNTRNAELTAQKEAREAEQ